MSQKPTIALVTGGAVRVGAAIVRALASAGCHVTFTYRRSEREARSLEAELAAVGATARGYALDFNDPSAAEMFGRSFASASPALDVLVHSASIYEPTPLETLTIAEAERHYRVNALAPLILTRELAPVLAGSKMAGGGSIVCMVDIHASERPRKAFSAYAMSKAALEQMVRVLALELAPGVRVNAVAPGVVAFASSGPDSDPEMQARYLKRVPLARSGTPEDAAEAVRWLALDARYTTGQILRVDGGRWLT